jgi:hypothetical protein
MRSIWFILDGDKRFIGTANVNRQWIRNVQKTPEVKLSIGGESFNWHCPLIRWPAAEEVAARWRMEVGRTACDEPVVGLGLLAAVCVFSPASPQGPSSVPVRPTRPLTIVRS